MALARWTAVFALGFRFAQGTRHAQKSLAIVAVIAAALVAGCTTKNLEELRQAGRHGDAFTAALTDGYLALANFEADIMNDWPDQAHFARKGLRAAAGEAVLPEDPAQWKLSPEAQEMTYAGRARLIQALANGAAVTAPERAAEAQVAFDCWVEQLEEKWQPQDINACHGRFSQAIAELEVQHVNPGRIVYFEFDSDVIGPAAYDDVVQGAFTALQLGLARATIVGHADRAGSVQHNFDLSERRARSIARVLLDVGLDLANLQLVAKGESEPAVPTPDGVREALNRRGEVAFR